MDPPLKVHSLNSQSQEKVHIPSDYFPLLQIYVYYVLEQGVYLTMKIIKDNNMTK